MSKTTEQYEAEIKRLMNDVDIALDQTQAALKSEFDAWQKVEKLERELAEVRKDAERWKTFEKVLCHGRFQGAGHGRQFKIIEISPVHGEAEYFSDFIEAIDAASVAQANKEQGNG